MGTGINFLREPLLHFLFIGAALFFVFYTTQDRSNFNQSKDIIVISPSDIDRLAYFFEKTWRRPPNDKELRGIVDDYLEEEVLYREALRLGLDKDDTVVRRRMRQKMEFFVNDISEQTEPTTQQLEEFLNNNKENYRVEPAISFQQIYFKPDKDTEKTEKRINNIKNKLYQQTTSVEDSQNIGDATILPFEFKQTTLSEIDNQFGKWFGAKFSELDELKWQGPIESAYGFHLIFIEEKTEEYIPKLSEIRNEVQRDWKYSLNKDLEQEYFRIKLDQYKVQIQWPDRNESIADKKN